MLSTLVGTAWVDPSWAHRKRRLPDRVALRHPLVALGRGSQVGVNINRSSCCSTEQTYELLVEPAGSMSAKAGAGLGDLAMKGFLFLSLVGALIYGSLVVSNDLLPSDRADESLARQNLGNPAARQLRSWGSDLPSLVSSNSQTTLQQLQEPSLTAPSSEGRQYSSAAAGVVTVSPSVSRQNSSKAFAAIEPIKLTVTARVHSRPYVSSPILRFYSRGTALQVVDRQNGWVQIADPTSGEEGWVLEQYLVATEGTSVTQTAIETETNKALTPMRSKPTPSAKKRIRAPRPTVRMPENVALAQFDRRWARRAERRGSFGLFSFGRFAGGD
jgi:SH3-like domain-containing protein